MQQQTDAFAVRSHPSHDDLELEVEVQVYQAASSLLCFALLHHDAPSVALLLVVSTTSK
jgi:hypothetical protein